MNPVPHNAIDSKASTFTGYTTMMFMFGFSWGWVNLLAAYGYCRWWQGERGYRTEFAKTAVTLFSLFIALPVFALLCIMPFFGGWIVTPIVQKVRPICR